MSTVKTAPKKPATKPAKKTEKKPVEKNVRLAELKAACEVLGFTEKKYGKGESSHVCKVPTFKEFINTTPRSKDGKQAIALMRGLMDCLGDFNLAAGSTLVIHNNSIAIYAK